MERQIALASTLNTVNLVERAKERDKNHPDFLSAEALAYFIRRAGSRPENPRRPVPGAAAPHRK